MIRASGHPTLVALIVTDGPMPINLLWIISLSLYICMYNRKNWPSKYKWIHSKWTIDNNQYEIYHATSNSFHGSIIQIWTFKGAKLRVKISWVIKKNAGCYLKDSFRWSDQILIDALNFCKMCLNESVKRSEHLLYDVILVWDFVLKVKKIV